ncbi:MAG: hypothetical protein P8L31_08885, partial [Pseudomonadales bacterium]|nr:hypothetical protein [Pseudomonadales bacterium]
RSLNLKVTGENSILRAVVALINPFGEIHSVALNWSFRQIAETLQHAERSRPNRALQAPQPL